VSAAGRRFWAWPFVGPSGWRAGWRFLAFFVIGMIIAKSAWAVVSFCGYTESDQPWNQLDLLVDTAASALAAFGASWAMARLERRSLDAYAVTPSAGLFLQGALWGLLASSLVLVTIWAAGGAVFHGVAQGEHVARSVAVWLVVMLLLGVAEELLYRAYPLYALSSGMGFWPAAVLLSLLFGAVHLSKPGETALDVANIALFGLFCCFTIRRTGSAWFAIGLHGISDFADLALYAAPNTGAGGKAIAGHLLDVDYVGPDWLSGGHCGMEASVFSLVAFLAMFALFHKLHPSAVWPART
jgi:uncharacterized protein